MQDWLTSPFRISSVAHGPRAGSTTGGEAGWETKLFALLPGRREEFLVFVILSEANWARFEMKTKEVTTSLRDRLE